MKLQQKRCATTRTNALGFDVPCANSRAKGSYFCAAHESPGEDLMADEIRALHQAAIDKLQGGE